MSEGIKNSLKGDATRAFDLLAKMGGPARSGVVRQEARRGAELLVQPGLTRSRSSRGTASAARSFYCRPGLTRSSRKGGRFLPELMAAQRRHKRCRCGSCRPGLAQAGQAGEGIFPSLMAVGREAQRILAWMVPQATGHMPSAPRPPVRRPPARELPSLTSSLRRGRARGVLRGSWGGGSFLGTPKPGPPPYPLFPYGGPQPSPWKGPPGHGASRRQHAQTKGGGIG